MHLAELAWHIGNRHLAAAIRADRILILRDHVIKAMLEGLGAKVADVVEPFTPVRGAYSGHGHGHDDHHDHDHGHHHGHDHGTTMATVTANSTPLAAGRAIRIMATTMADGRTEAAQLRLMAFLSPAFPVGGFSYSHGLERAAHDGLLPDAGALGEWLSDLIAFGSGWNDAVLFAEAHRRGAADHDLVDLAELAEALAGSQERHRESMLQGAAFVDSGSRVAASGSRSFAG